MSARVVSDDEKVDYFSILDHKDQTKNYWENKMQTALEARNSTHNKTIDAISPPLPFVDFRNGTGEDTPTTMKQRPVKQYIFGEEETIVREMDSHALLIEEEIREHQRREAETLKKQRPVVSAEEQAIVENFLEKETRLQQESEARLTAEKSAFQSAQPELNGSVHVVDQVIYDVATTDSSPAPPSTYFDERPNSTETKIALEIRQLKEREAELRMLRERYGGSKDLLVEPEGLLRDRDMLGEEGYASLTTNATDDGNLSGYVSEDKESSSEGNTSRIMSPELPSSGHTFSHQRTQSQDSVSSGHSSGSHSVLSNSYSDFYTRRRVTVRPFEDPDEKDDCKNQPQSPAKETPIEREIRLAREREEELRKEKESRERTGGKKEEHKEVRRLLSKPSATSSQDPLASVATSRIQQEINQTAEREKEFKMTSDVPTSSNSWDGKVTKYSELLQEKDRSRTLPKTVSTPPRASPAPSCSPSPSPTFVPNFTPSPSPQPQKALAKSLSASHLPATPLSATLPGVRQPSPTVRKISTPTPAAKGLMLKFIASKGKMKSFTTFVPSTKDKTLVPLYTPKVVPKATPKVTPTEKPAEESSETTKIPRRSFPTAEEKIQEELKDMRSREEELKRQRAKMLARSSPNLLAALQAEADAQEEELRDATDSKTTPTLAILQRTMSNPNLLDDDSDTSQGLSNRTSRRRSNLIAQWETRIQQGQE